MTWTRLDDTWTEQEAFEDLDFATRWHYLAMIQFCCRNDKHNGVIRHVDAMRVSDHPDPKRALAELTAAGKLEVDTKAYRIVDIADHVPPSWVVNKQERDRNEKRKKRAHAAGDHSLCWKPECRFATDFKPGSRDESRDDKSDDPRDGSGRDGTGGSIREGKLEATESWNVVELPKARA